MLLTTSIAAPAVVGADNLPTIHTIYTYGDSLSDQGNLFAATDLLILPEMPGTGIPRADYYFQGRFSNGWNWVDFLADELDAYSDPSFYTGTNFAYGGTRTKYNTVEVDSSKKKKVRELAAIIPQGNAFPEDVFPWTLEGQRKAYKETKPNDPDALHIAFSGSNDLVDIIFMVGLGILDLEEDAGEWIAKVVTGVEKAVDKYIDRGAKNILVPNLPNLGVVPGIPGPFKPLATALSAQFNAALSTMLAAKAELVNIIPFDTFILTTDVINNPSEFGFTNASNACYSGFVSPEDGETITVCENPDSYVFWDREHPTEAFHQLLADKVLQSIAANWEE
jgi:phospholipase/lecithinase/hemolysin